MKRSLCVVAFVLGAFAQSQPPSPTPSKTTNTDQEHAGTKHTVSDSKAQIQPPSTSSPVNALTESKKGNKADKGNSDPAPQWWTPEWVTATCTVLIAIIAAIQVYVYCKQAAFMKRGLAMSLKHIRVAARSASASMISAKAAADGVSTAEKTLKAIEGQGIIAAEALEATKQTAIAATTSAKAADASARAGSLQFELTERPWLSVEVGALSDFVFDPMGASVAIGITITNTGRSPACNVHIQPILYFGDQPYGEREQLCEEILTIYPEPETIFPGANKTVVTKVNGNRTDIDEHKTAGSGEGYVSVALIICVAYRASFNVSNYFTATLHHLGQQETQPPRFWHVLEVGRKVPRTEICLNLNQVSGTIVR